MEKYTLSIVNNKSKQIYKKFSVDGFNTIGVDELEPFTIRFKNNTHNRVQVRLSVDGTDILSGKPATTSTGGDMFLIEGYRSIDIKAWPESLKGGAELLFTPERDGVAANTHGNMSSKGIIAAAVFEEGYEEPVKVYPHPYPDTSYGQAVKKTGWLNPQGDADMEKVKDIKILKDLTGKGIMECKNALELCNWDVDLAYEQLEAGKRLTKSCDMAKGGVLRDETKGVTIGRTSLGHAPAVPLADNISECSGRMDYSCHVDARPAAASGKMDMFDCDMERAVEPQHSLGSRRLVRSRSLSVGAGEKVEQNLVKLASGLRKPVFTSIVQVKYLPWTDLRSRVRSDTNHLSYAHPGFPGDSETLCNIKDTPRYEEVNIGVIKRVATAVRRAVVDRFADISRFE